MWKRKLLGDRFSGERFAFLACAHVCFCEWIWGHRWWVSWKCWMYRDHLLSEWTLIFLKKYFFLDQFSCKIKHLKDSSNNFLGRKDGRCSELGSAADTEMWLGSIPWHSTRVLCSTRGLGTFQKLAKSGTDLLAATVEGSYWSMPSSQEVTGKSKESKTSNQIPIHLINLTWKFCLKAVKE